MSLQTELSVEKKNLAYYRPKVAPHPDISDSDGSLHISSFLPHQLLGIIIKTFLMHAVDKRISIL